MTQPRVLILGGGMAGLVAARALARAGADVDVIEARERLGGRVLTEHVDAWPLPIELGPEFVHGRPQATLKLLEAAQLRQLPVIDRHHWLRPSGARQAGELEALPDFWERVGGLLNEVDLTLPDMSAASFAERLMLEGDARGAFELLVRGFHAAPPSDVSIQSLAAEANDSAAPNAGEQWRVEGGYGSVVRWLSEQLQGTSRCRLHLGSRALVVAWQAGHVSVDVQQSDRIRRISGSRLLVTLPVGVLAARGSEGGIDFAPYLVQKREALWMLAMAQVSKVVLRFRAPFWRQKLDGFEFLHSATSPFVSFWRQRAGTAEQITAWAGAPPVGAQRPAAGAVDAALLALCELLGAEPGEARAVLLGAHCHDFERDPFARGAYSYVRPGGTRAHAMLAQPIDGTLFFAGEATDADEPGTVAGAIRSGERAAREILES